MKKHVAFILICVLSLSLFPVTGSAASLSAESAVLIEAESGKIIFSHNYDKRLGMASTTKIMTGLVAVENSSPDDLIEVDERAVGIEGSSVYLERGERLTVRQLVYSLLLQSANDAAEALAYHVSGGIAEFAEMMNARACEIGLTSTHFTNPHGLYDENHYTTAYELALITREALKNETFREIVATKSYTFSSESKTRTIVNHNRLLKTYEGCIGVKTGFTKATGRCLVSAAQRDGVTLICVTLNAPDDWNDHRKLLDLGFETCERRTLAEEGGIRIPVCVTGSDSDCVYAVNRDRAELTLLEKNADVRMKVYTDRFLFAPVKKGEKIGYCAFETDGEIIATLDLYADRDANEKNARRKFLGVF